MYYSCSLDLEAQFTRPFSNGCVISPCFIYLQRAIINRVRIAVGHIHACHRVRSAVGHIHACHRVRIAVGHIHACHLVRTQRKVPEKSTCMFSQKGHLVYKLGKYSYHRSYLVPNFSQKNIKTISVSNPNLFFGLQN